MPRVATLGLLAGFVVPFGSLRADSEGDFRGPPSMMCPHVWWRWMGPCFNEGGINKDLQALARAARETGPLGLDSVCTTRRLLDHRRTLDHSGTRHAARRLERGPRRESDGAAPRASP
jgi:hypothetical protein